MNRGQNRLQALDESECQRLLAGAVIGRLAYTEGALPAIQAVSFTMRGTQIVIPTRAGSKVAAASRGAVVAFEVDDFDTTTRTGWNVTVVGPSRVACLPDEVAALDALGAHPWAPADAPCYIVVEIALVRGRRIVAGPTDDGVAEAAFVAPAE
jgi:nitroimidazol reductase NimA-like FMN-containing flavoprotein (pyridoxamine 5'-phosphate oxidase superfamily)